MPNSSKMTGRTVLVVDDEAVFCQQISAVLKKLGAEVLIAKNGLLALDLLQSKKADLILCDIFMPELDGLAFLKKFRAQNTATPVVMISGHNDMQQVDQALKLGASDYLLKPIRNLTEFELNLISFFAAPELDQIGRGGLLQNGLAEHFGHYRANDMAASRLLTDLLPETPQIINGFHLYYRRRGVHIVPEFLPINNGRFCLFAFDLSGLGQDAPVAGVIVKSLINEGYRRYNQGRDQVIAAPDKFCASINRQLWRAQIKAPIPFFHMVSDDAGLEFTYCNAGFVEVSGLLKNGNEVAAMALGTSEMSRYQCQSIKLLEPVADLGLGNLHGEGLYFKIGSI